MKKYIVFFLGIVAMFLLSSCGATPVDYTVEGMHYQLTSDYVQETDQETANKNLNDTLTHKEDSEEDGIPYLKAEDFLAVQWFDGPYSVSVTAMYSPHNNDDFEGAIDGAYPNDHGKYEQVSVDSTDGRKGTYQKGSSSNYNIDFLRDGILYTVTFLNAGDSMSEDEVTSFIDSISFDSSLIKDKTIECGDYKMTISGLYQPAEPLDDADYHDSQSFIKYGKDKVGLSVLYLKRDDYVSAKEMANLMKDELEGAETSEISEEFGTCYCTKGAYNDANEVMAFFEDGEKLYMLELIGETTDVTVEDMQVITKTIKKKDS